MPPELPNEQELTLKKRARRRLVGAVALVLLMVIILPQVLQDRALQAQQEPIKITMPEVEKNVPEPIPTQAAALTPQTQAPVQQQLPATEPVKSTHPSVTAEQETAASNEVKNIGETESKEVKPKKPEQTQSKVQTQKQDQAQVASIPENKLVAKAAEEVKPAAVKTQGTFAVQVGVYADAANVKRLQEQLKQAGFNTYTEKVQTSKGESLRLKAGSFKTRQDAVDALAKVKSLGLPGIVISND